MRPFDNAQGQGACSVYRLPFTIHNFSSPLTIRVARCVRTRIFGIDGFDPPILLIRVPPKPQTTLQLPHCRPHP